MEVEVYIEPDEGVSRTERLDIDGPITIGRHSQCHLYLDGDRISRVHLIVEIKPERLYIEDRSSNGTLVGERLLNHESIEVPYATPIIVGGYTLLIKPTGLTLTPGLRRPLNALGTSLQSDSDPASTVDTTGIPLPLPGMPAAGVPSPVAHFSAPPLPRTTPSSAPPGPLGGNPPLPRPRASRSLVAEQASAEASRLDPAAASKQGASGSRPTAPPARPNPSPPRPLGPRFAVSQGMPTETGSKKNKSPAPPNEPSVALAAPKIQAQALVQGPPAAPEAKDAAAPSGSGQLRSTEEHSVIRREIHARLLASLDLPNPAVAKPHEDASMRPRVLGALQRIVAQLETRLDPDLDRDVLVSELADEALGLGPLERFLTDPSVSEIMVVDPTTIFIEQGGKRIKVDARFTDDERVRTVIERLVTPLGHRIDESSPWVDARMKDGSRIHAVIKPLALRGACITIQKSAKVPLTLDQLVSGGALTESMARFLLRSVLAKKNILIAGGAGSGKTALLNALSSAIPGDERIVTLEVAAELKLSQPHVVGLESRPPNGEGRGECTVRDLLRVALRMRPDRLVLGDCRGGEALDLLQAMNTGRDGSLATTHGSSPHDAVARLEKLSLLGGLDLPSHAIREQIAAGLHLVVQQTRFSDGSRRVSLVSEVSGIEDDGRVGIRPIFEFVRTGTGPSGKVLGEHRHSGYQPSFLDTFVACGLVRPGEPCL